MSAETEMARVERANEAKTILQSRLWSEAWQAIDGALVDKWRSARVESERTELWHYVQITGKLKQYFEHVISDGDMAKGQLDVLRHQASFTERLQDKMRKLRG